MRTLPLHEHLPPRSAAYWLLSVGLLLWANDAFVFKTALRHSAPLIHVGGDGIPSTVYVEPVWEFPVRLGVPLLAVVLLIVMKRIDRRDVGFTLGRPSVTFFWVLFPVALLLALGLLAGLALLVVRLCGFTLPIPKPVMIDGMHVFWYEAMRTCIFAPLVEEPLYRGIPAAALQRLGGRRLALPGCGVLWMLLHLWYGWPPVVMPYYFLFWGVLATWVYLRTHSLVTTILLHAAGNLIAPVLVDYVLLEHHDLLARLLGH